MPNCDRPFNCLNTLRIVVLNLCLLAVEYYCTACHTNKEPSNSPTPSFVTGVSAQPGSRIFHLNEPDGVIDLVISYGNIKVSDESIVQWVQLSAKAISTYFGRYPLHRARVNVSIGGPGRIEEGVTTEEGISVKIGQDTQQSDIDEDWVMTHEMFHLAFPDVDDQYHWLQEGLASYLEPLARARIGNLTPQKVWLDLVEGMPEGQPEPGDRGLDNTHTWGRTYWGGSMYCLLADLRIREQTHNRRSIDDAMRAILDQGGDHLHQWTLDKVFEVGDHVTGTTVLRDLHQEMGGHPVTINLDELWKRLGVKYKDGAVTFDDNAPLAAIRISMTKRVKDID